MKGELNQTLVIIKPDGLKKSLTGNILTRLSETKLRIVGAKVVKVSRELAEPTSIRGQYGRLTSAGLFENVLHCSADKEEAEREIKLWFEPGETVD